MVVVHRAHGNRFVIVRSTMDRRMYTLPNRGRRKQSYGTRGERELVWSVGIKRPDMRRLFAEVVERREEFLKAWEGSMADLTEDQLRKAEALGREMLQT